MKCQDQYSSRVMCNRLFSCPSILQQRPPANFVSFLSATDYRVPSCKPRLELPFGRAKQLVASALKAADLAPGAALHMSERVHPWQECNERLEARAAARRWRRRHQHQEAGRCHADGHAKATARTAPGTPSTARTACTSLLAYQNLPSSPNLLASPSRAAGLYARPISRTALLHALSAPCH